MRSLRVSVGLVVLAAALVGGADRAGASVAGQVQVAAPTTASVGDVGLPVVLKVSNTNTPPNEAESNTVTLLALMPSCGTVALTCSFPDPGVFTVASGTGRAGTACAGRSFEASAPDANGVVTFAVGGGPLVLAPPSAGQAASSCTVDLAVGVLKMPSIDAAPASPGVQTAMNLSANLQGQGGGTATSRAVTPVSVTPATPVLATQASLNLAAGTIRDTATVKGPLTAPVPTGTVLFQVFGPADAVCAGPPLATSTNALAGGIATSADFPAKDPGTYRFLASYSGDANYLPVTAPCNAPNENITVPTVPAAPTNVQVVPSGTSVSVSFTPGSNGGSAITSFQAKCSSPDGGSARSMTGAGSPLVVSGLTAGKSYLCFVRATNAAGTGPFSSGSSSFTAVAVPAAPTNVVATPSGSTVSVSFTPGSNGGSPITGFNVKCSSPNGGSARSVTGAASPLVVTNLTGGVSYLCFVRAINAVGIGPFSSGSASFAVPARAPAPPTGVTVTKNGTSATVAFTPGSSNGSPITSFTANCISSDGGVAKGVAGPSSPIVVNGLTTGKTYTCSVKATNALGKSGASAPSAPFVV